MDYERNQARHDGWEDYLEVEEVEEDQELEEDYSPDLAEPELDEARAWGGVDLAAEFWGGRMNQ